MSLMWVAQCCSLPHSLQRKESCELLVRLVIWYMAVMCVMLMAARGHTLMSFHGRHVSCVSHVFLVSYLSDVTSWLRPAYLQFCSAVVPVVSIPDRDDSRQSVGDVRHARNVLQGWFMMFIASFQPWQWNHSLLPDFQGSVLLVIRLKLVTQTSGFVAILGIEDQFHNFGVQAHIYYCRHERNIRKSMTRIFISYCQPGRSGVTFHYSSWFRVFGDCRGCNWELNLTHCERKCSNKSELCSVVSWVRRVWECIVATKTSIVAVIWV